ncbi:11772_t:CDS:10 [Ambispora gerdemannii]|uniref:Transcription elongation factor SPT6 n=1 Tax=Ambispora gerdemannii TaxID=144530 RepID=A0A9N9BTD2_9GLOM|nr:11772_t:CDS:10 [Ambispora gerdemannii]
MKNSKNSRKPVKRHKKKSKRKRSSIETESDSLDDDDLALVQENTGLEIQRSEKKFKRIKRGGGHFDEENDRNRHDLNRIFDDEDMIDESLADDIDEFVVDDYEEEGELMEEEREAQMLRSGKGIKARIDSNQEKIRLWEEFFGVDGEQYDWAYNLAKMKSEPIPVTDLKQVYEPAVLEERMLTEKDEVIRTTDSPERMQLREGIENSLRALTDEEIEEETNFILKTANFQSFVNSHSSVRFQALVDATTKVLKHLSQMFMEVPYIYYQRRDDIATINLKNTGMPPVDILTLDDLWTIYDLDIKYRAFLEGREKLQAFVQKMDIHSDYTDRLLSEAESIEELNDIREYLNLVQYTKISSTLEKNNKKRRMPEYQRLKQYNFHALAEKFGIDRQAVCKTFSLTDKLYYPNDQSYDVNLTVEEFLRAFNIQVNLETIDQQRTRVLEDAKRIVAYEIAFDPHVRKVARKWILKKGIIQTFKFLNKPIHKFIEQKSGQFLQILQSEKEGLTKVSISYEESDIKDKKGIDPTEDLFNALCQKLSSDNMSAIADDWNYHRKDIARIIFEEFLLKFCEVFLRSKLQSEAEDWVAAQCTKSLEKRINVLPFRPETMDHDENVPRVLALSFGFGNRDDLIEGVLVDNNCLVEEVFKFNQNFKDNHSEREAFAQLLESKNHPDVIAISGYSSNTRRLLEQVKELVKYCRKDDEIYVTVANDEVAVIARGSRYYVHESAIKGYSPLQAYCVSLARRLQSPIHEYIALESNLPMIRHHPLKDLVPKEKLNRALERAFINVVNMNGVDILEAVNDSYKAQTLQYVCGLGPRKAQDILNQMRERYYKEDTEIRTRHELSHLMTENVYRNCASFIRLGEESSNPLDRTRIHPSDYDLSVKMAADALDMEHEQFIEGDKDKSAIIEDVIKHPKKLNILNLEMFAEVLKTMLYGTSRKIALYNIQHELSKPYSDKRHKFPELSPDEQFDFLMKDETLAPNMIVAVEIYRVEDNYAKGQLTQSGLDGYINIKNISDENIHKASQVLSKGQVIDCAILRIDKTKFSCELSCRKSVIKKYTEIPVVEKDPFYDRDAEIRFSLDKTNDISRKLIMPVLPKSIDHYLYKRMTYKEAEEFLASKKVGDLVIRPSRTKRNEGLAITWKIAPDIYQHIEIDETVTEKNTKKLKVGSYEYDDIDELIVTHIEASSRKVEELCSHPKYRHSADELASYIETSITANPRQCAYGFYLDRKNPGNFYLGYKLSADWTKSHWVGSIRPDRFILNNETYSDIPKMISGFKKSMSMKMKSRISGGR